jgi:hypothetical protein
MKKDRTMAMEGDRQRAGGSASRKEWRNRIDPRHSPGDVPVLFRLKNLQRVEAAVEVANSPSPVRATESAPIQTTTRLQRQSTTPFKDAAPEPLPTRSPSPTKPLTASDSEKTSKPSKHGVSNGFILLAVLVGVAFVLGQSIGKPKPGTVTNQPLAQSNTTATEPSKSEPVAAAPAIKEEAVALAAPTSTMPEEKLQIPTLPTLPDFDNKSSEDEDLALPPTLEIASKESATTDETDSKDGKQENEDAKTSLEIASSDVNSSDFSSPDFPSSEFAMSEADASGESFSGSAKQPESTSDSFATASTVDGNAASSKPAPGPSVTSSDTPFRTTNTPATDFEQMYRLRSDYLSQRAALAQTRPVATPTAPAPAAQVATNPTLQANPSFTSPVGPVPGTPTLNAQPVNYAPQQNVAPTMAPYPTSMPTANTNPSATYQPNLNYQVPSGPSMQPVAPTNVTNSFLQPANPNPQPSLPYQPMFPSMTQNSMAPVGNPVPTPGNYSTAPATPAPYQPIGSSFAPEGF